MKTFDDCLAWMSAVDIYRKSAPEGVHMASNDRVPTLREVEPLVILQLQAHFQSTETAPAVKYVLKLDGQEGGEYLSLTVHKTGFMGYKLSGTEYRFFYRKTSDRTRREAYDYAF